MTNLQKLLIKHEDLRLFAYDDATGKPLKPGDTLKGHVSIGIGRNLEGYGRLRCCYRRDRALLPW
jgi:lysozyme